MFYLPKPHLPEAVGGLFQTRIIIDFRHGPGFGIVVSVVWDLQQNDALHAL